MILAGSEADSDHHPGRVMATAAAGGGEGEGVEGEGVEECGEEREGTGDGVRERGGGGGRGGVNGAGHQSQESKANHGSCFRKGTRSFQSLLSLSNLYDNLSLVDTMGVRSHDSHVMQRTVCHAPWWKCSAQTDLLDELPFENTRDGCSVMSGSVVETNMDMMTTTVALSCLQCKRGVSAPLSPDEHVTEEEDVYGMTAVARMQRYR